MDEETRKILINEMIELKYLVKDIVKRVQDRMDNLAGVVNNHADALFGIRTVMDEYAHMFIKMKIPENSSD